jgi:TM2 domain-containing membrane protein YozV
MPHLNFILPHWLYWGTLILFPLVAMYFVQRQLKRGVPRGPSLFIAYLFWATGGIMGLHRFYLRSMWGFIFVPVFLLSLHVSDGIRDRREDVSRTHAAYETAVSAVRRLTLPPGVSMTQNEQARRSESEDRSRF